MSAWSPDVCASDLRFEHLPSPRGDRAGPSCIIGIAATDLPRARSAPLDTAASSERSCRRAAPDGRHYRAGEGLWRSEEHTSELQSLMRISYAVFCLKKKNNNNRLTNNYRATQ